jgi:hypothetical protein
MLPCNCPKTDQLAIEHNTDGKSVGGLYREEANGPEY